jgi:hypothetical protein
MGSWGVGPFDNDGAADMIALTARRRREDAKVLEGLR